MIKNKKYPLIILLGPTAVGKTSLSLDIAEEINAEIISADSMQIYKDMDIGTDKIKEEYRKIIKHHMIDIITPENQFSVADYQKKVDKIIPKIVGRGKIPLMVGGTGLYINAIVEGFTLPQMEKNNELRKKLKREAEVYGNKYIHEKLNSIDPDLAQKLHPNDLRRVIRGIEIYEQTGKTKTYFEKKQEQRPPRYNYLKIGLKRSRQSLYERINLRVEQMIKKGLIKETKMLRKKYDLSKTALQALGYKEIINFLDNNYDKDEAIRLIKRNTRHLAKKQLTWFKRDEDINWFNLSDNNNTVYKEILELIESELNSNFKGKGEQ